MATISIPTSSVGAATTRTRRRIRTRMPAAVALLPTALVVLIVYIGCMLWTVRLSFTSSTLLPKLDWVGLAQYSRLFANDRFLTSASNIVIFGALFITGCLILGFLLAVFIDQNVRGEGVFRTLFLYPYAMSFVVTGIAWQWFLNPGLGLEKTMQAWGFTWFKFDWLVNPDMAIYTVVIAGVWQASGFCMAMFLAGLRGIDNEILKAAQIDGASTAALYRRIVIPLLRPVFLSAFIVLAHMAIKSYDLVIALTGGGPGNATELPSTFMYSYTFTRNQMAVGAASAVIMLMTICAVIVPYLYSELREKNS